jgi:hypothetical protein
MCILQYFVYLVLVDIIFFSLITQDNRIKTSACIHRISLATFVIIVNSQDRRAKTGQPRGDSPWQDCDNKTTRTTIAEKREQFTQNSQDSDTRTVPGQYQDCAARTIQPG